MRILFPLVLSLSLFLTSIPRAEALVGLAISSRTVKSVGGIMSAAGVGGAAIGVGLNAIFGNAYALLAISLLGATTGIIGIVVLDEKSAELKFSMLDSDKASLIDVTAEELEIFNSEVEELNLLKNEIESRISRKTTEEEVSQQWKAARQYLAPETLKVAARIIAVSLEAKK
jgi:proteasome assembly chaperone (PAC2) family protein